MIVYLTNDVGVSKQVKVGFSWTTFFFGLFVPLVRGDLKWALIMFLVQLLAGSFTMGIGSWVASLIFSFIYNKIYIRDLVDNGFYAKDEAVHKTILNYINN